MKIIDVVNKIKKYHKGININGVVIDENTTRDKILYGDANVECTGIVTSCWASMDVIKKAHELGANLIITHEALFWNRGDKIDWLIEETNKTFLKKQKLLDETGIVVWRDHDYMHSGIPYGDGYIDGIYYGFTKVLGWEEYLTDKVRAKSWIIPETPIKDIVEHMKGKFNLKTIRIIGNPDAMISKIKVVGHIKEGGDRSIITDVENEGINLAITLELIDFTLSEYIRDAGMQGQDKAIVSLGHFNCEEPGMQYMIEWIPNAIESDIPCHYVKSGDMYSYM